MLGYFGPLGAELPRIQDRGVQQLDEVLSPGQEASALGYCRGPRNDQHD